MTDYRIEDNTVIEALRAAGFSCEKPQPQLIPGAIHFYTRTAEEERAAEAASVWYETDCPIPPNGTYRLPGGRILLASGTALAWEEIDPKRG